jgi:hypothetical protein
MRIPALPLLFLALTACGSDGAPAARRLTLTYFTMTG